MFLFPVPALVQIFLEAHKNSLLLLHHSYQPLLPLFVSLEVMDFVVDRDDRRFTTIVCHHAEDEHQAFDSCVSYLSQTNLNSVYAVWWW